MDNRDRTPLEYAQMAVDGLQKENEQMNEAYLVEQFFLKLESIAKLDVKIKQTVDQLVQAIREGIIPREEGAEKVLQALVKILQSLATAEYGATMQYDANTRIRKTVGKPEHVEALATLSPEERSARDHSIREYTANRISGGIRDLEKLFQEPIFARIEKEKLSK